MFEVGRIEAGDWRSQHPSQAEIERGQAQRDNPPSELLGIDLNVAEQLRLAGSLPAFEPGPRYGDNAYFPPADAFVLHGILKSLQPRTVIEIGSGHSSAVMLDSHKAAYTFIDPEPERLRSLLVPGDAPTTIERPVQDVPVDLFGSLDSDDVLFVDSSHISKMGSDVNHIFFEILPRLRSGTWVHFHDVFYPFEYPREWVEYGWLRNEAYLLRAMLTHNPTWRIRLFSSYLSVFHSQEVPRELIGGGSIWLSRG